MVEGSSGGVGTYIQQLARSFWGSPWPKPGKPKVFEGFQGVPDLRQYAQVMVKRCFGGVGTSINTIAASHQGTKHNAL